MCYVIVNQFPPLYEAAAMGWKKKILITGNIGVFVGVCLYRIKVYVTFLELDRTNKMTN